MHTASRTYYYDQGVTLSAIKRDTPRLTQNDDVAASLWFIPESVNLDARMIQDMGDQWWMKRIYGIHQSKLPGGAIVQVSAIYHGSGGRALTMLDAFAESVDFVLNEWQPNDPFTSYKLLRKEVTERWSGNFEWISR